MSTRTEGYGGTGGVQYPVRQPVTTPTIIEPKKDYSAHEYTVQGKGTLSNLGKDTLLKEANSATGNFQAKSLRDSQNLQGVSNTANHVTENILHSNHANNTVPLHGEKKLSSEMEELQSKKQGIERELTKIENKLQIRSNPQLLKTQEKLLNELSSLSLQELTLSMEESKDKADDIAQSKFHQVTNTNAERTNSIFTTRKANITSSKSATSASYTNITTSSSTSKTRTESLAKNLQHKEVPHEGLQIRHISTMTTKTAELTDPVTINKANVVKKFLVLERQQRYEAPVNKEKADQLKQDRESKIKALFENFPAEAKSGLNNTAAPSSEVAYLQEFMKENEAVLNKHSEIKGYANQIIANDQNQKLIPEVKAKLVEVIEALVVHQLDVDAQNMKTEKGPLPLMSVNDFAKLLFHPPSNKGNINNFLVANRDLKTQLLLADDKNTLKFEEGKPTKVINAQNGEMTVDRNSSLFIFLKATFEKPETSLYEKQQILNIAEQWLKDPFINSYHVSEMEQYIGDLIGLAQAEKSPLLKTAGENLIDSFKRASAVEKPDLKFEGIHDVNVLMKSLRAGELKKGKENYQKAVKDFAGSIRGQNSKQYQAITSEEFNNQIWTKKDAQINAPNIAMNTKIFNKLTEFTIDSILDTDSFPDIDLSDEKNKDTPLAEKGVKTRLKEAGRVAEFYGDVLNELLSSENGFVDFNGSMAIQQGLKSGAIKRLPLDLSKEVKKNIVDFETLTNPGSSNKNLRDKYNELDKNKISYIPYQGMFLTDVTFTIEGNKTNHEHEINPNMVKGLGTVINGVKTRQRDLKKEEFTQGNVFNMQSINERKTSDDRQYDISELLVPRESKDKKTKK